FFLRDRFRLGWKLGDDRTAALLGDEGDGRARPLQFTERFVNDCGVVLREPVAEQRVRHAHANRSVSIRDKRRRLEPGVEAVAVDFGFDSGQDVVPDVAAGHTFRGPFALGNPFRTGERTVEAAIFTRYLRAVSDFRPLAFPHFFPQLWKTSGGDPT